jgi:type IV secretory pathway TrbD component
MTSNMGAVDRSIRIVTGVALLVWGFMAQNWLGAMGLVPLVTGFVRFCPAYVPFGLSTCPPPEGEG